MEAKLTADYTAAKIRLTAEEEALEEVKAKQGYSKEARSIAQLVAQAVQHEAHKQVATIVTRCLATVFEEPYEFAIRFERKRGRTEARMVFLRNGAELDPLTAAGLGVADVASFALRLAALVLGRPQRRRLLVLDEPMKFLSADHRNKVGDLFIMLAKDMDIQFILITHLPELQLGKVIKLT